MQPPATSAVYRELHPEDFDRSSTVDRLETVAVLIERSYLRLIGATSLPARFSDLFESPQPKPDPSTLLSWEEVERQMGWTTE